MNNVTVRFEDVTSLGTYRFATPLAFEEWEVVPRVGDHILDKNEFKYKVTDVIWYSPRQVAIQVERPLY